MKTAITEKFGIEFPLFAFTHCRDVVVAVSRAGGMGVLGAVNHPPERLKEELEWIDAHIDGKPYGVDLIVPNKFEGKGEKIDEEALRKSIPAEHRDFVEKLLADYNIVTADEAAPVTSSNFSQNLQEEGAIASMQVAFQHPIKIIVNALGVPPQSMKAMAEQHGVATGALVGAKEHAIAQVAAGVDVLIAAGGEAGGHCGEVSTMVLIPEICRELEKIGADVPVLAAGGITTGEQMAAAMSMGAAGAWCGSVWLATIEAETNPIVKEKMLAATSRDTVRSRARTGKHSRQLRSPWTDAWESDAAPTALPMPLQSLVVEPVLARIDKLSQGGHDGAKELATYWVGQGVGLMSEQLSTAQVVQQFKTDFITAFERLTSAIDM
ncbi:MAG: nitronate monooxygenase [Alphaproteobacteria bacterium]|nr:nitronate monooxygenase [Alphaproteobacteria bacterium]